jgi:hypothetical protein
LKRFTIVNPGLHLQHLVGFRYAPPTTKPVRPTHSQPVHAPLKHHLRFILSDTLAIALTIANSLSHAPSNAKNALIGIIQNEKPRVIANRQLTFNRGIRKRGDAEYL